MNFLPLLLSLALAASASGTGATQGGAAPAKAPATASTKGSLTAKGSAADASVRWVGLENGLKQASASGKYVFVSVYTDWCGYCRKLNNVTLRAEPVLAELEKNFESVKINAESEETLVWNGKSMTARSLVGKAWGVSGYPTLLFINPKGKVIGTFSSYVEPEVMVKLLTYISSGARERKVSFDDYLGEKG